MSNKFYVTTSIAYVNAKPHIGFAMELIQADVLARYHRLRGDDTYFLTGTDEHGSKLVKTANEQDKDPHELAHENAAHFKLLVEKLNVSADQFIRTTHEEHKKGAQKMWRALMDSGDIYKDSYEGLYCVGCEAFVLESDLVDGLCPNHNKPPEKLKEENYFFKLSKYSDKIKHAIESDELRVVPESRKNEILSVLNDGLTDVSFSRPRKVLPWGVDVPDDEDHVMYVWCDALSNYITAIGYEEETEDFKRYWPADVHLIGKDILRFHAAIWIGMLYSAGLQIPRAIYVHGFITSEGKKMSKSLGNVVDPFEYENRYGADALRYFLLREIPTTDDGDFSKDRFKTLYDTELANCVGNLLNRVVAMTGKYFDGMVPEVSTVNNNLKGLAEETWRKYEDAIAAFDLRVALGLAVELADYGNKYIEDSKPWELKKTDEEELKFVMYNLLELLRHIGFLLTPFLPEAAEKILCALGVAKGTPYAKMGEWGGLKAGTKVEKCDPIFARIEE